MKLIALQEDVGKKTRPVAG